MNFIAHIFVSITLIFQGIFGYTAPTPSETGKIDLTATSTSVQTEINVSRENSVKEPVVSPEKDSTYVEGQHDYISLPEGFKPNVAGGIGSVDIVPTTTPNEPFTLQQAQQNQAKYLNCVNDYNYGLYGDAPTPYCPLPYLGQFGSPQNGTATPPSNYDMGTQYGI